MRSWIFRHLPRLEAVYGAPGQVRPASRAPLGGPAGEAGAREQARDAETRGERLPVRLLVPCPRRKD